MEQELTDKTYLLQKFPGKGGWTYAEIPEIKPDKNNPFGWVKVKVTADNYDLGACKLMPMGNGTLFLPFKAAVRKKLKKEVGDRVRLTIQADHEDTPIPDEIMACFDTEPAGIYENFMKLKDGERKAYLDWIAEAKTEDTKVSRIVKMMERLQKNLGFYDK